MRTVIIIIGAAIVLLNALGTTLPGDWALLAIAIAGILTIIKELLEKLFPEVASAFSAKRSLSGRLVKFLLR